MGSYEFKIDIKLKNILFKDNYSEKIKSKNNYLGTFYDENISLYSLNNETFDYTYKNQILCNEIINYIDFNHSYPELVMSALVNGEIKIFRNKGESEITKEICLYKGHSLPVKYALFSPSPAFNNQVISSDKKNMKLWDIFKYADINIITNQKSITNLKWDYKGYKYGFIEDKKKLFILEGNNSKVIKSNEIINNFEFNNEEKVILFHDNAINIWDLKYNKEPYLTYKKNYSPKYIYNNLKYIYLMNKNCNEIEIFDTIKFMPIETQKISGITSFKNPILIDNDLLKGDEISNILELNRPNSILIKIRNKDEAKLIQTIKVMIIMKINLIKIILKELMKKLI